MDYQAGEITIYKNEEFLMMLAAAGLDSWYGIDLSDESSAMTGERIFNRNLAALYQKNVIEWGMDKAYIAVPYRPVFRGIKDAVICITVKSPKRPGYIKGCYCSEGSVVTVERRTASNDEIEVSMRTPSEWMDDLEESGYFPVSAGIPDKDDGWEGETAELISEFELRNAADGNLRETLRLYEQGLYGSMETVRNGIVAREYFSTDRMREVLTEWTGGRA